MTDNTPIYGTDADETLTGNGNNDFIYGEGGIDIIKTKGGDDTVSGGAGDDNLNLGSGNDTGYGDEGADRLSGGNGDDYLYGGLGDDRLYGGNGADLLYGEEGVDIINGGAGNDIIVGGLGDDVLAGATDSDTYYFELGDGHDRVNENLDDTGSIDTIEFGAGIRSDRLQVEQQGNHLVLSYSENDSIRINNFFRDEGDSRVERISFINGEVFNLASFVQGFNGSPDDDDIQGGASVDLISGGNGSDTLRGRNGDDTIYGGNQNDYLYGDGGNDTVYGGRGNDVFVGGQGNDTFYGEQGLDTVNYELLTAGVVADLSTGKGNGTVVKSNGTDTIYDAYRFIGSEYGDTVTAGRDSVAEGRGGDDVLVGNKGYEFLKGGDGNDTLNGKQYKDRLYGGAGDDTFEFERGGHQDLIMNDDAVSTNDRVDFAADIDHDQLWFEQSGNDLVVSVIGTNDAVTLQNWYTTGFTVDFFDSGNGLTLTSSDVENLVTAMSGMTKPGMGETDLSSADQATLDPILAANWS